MHKLFGCPYVLESEDCAVIRARDESYVFGRFQYPRRTFEQVATFADAAAAKCAFDAHNQAISVWRKAA